MIAVIGATGNTGRAVVKELKALGQDPMAIVRNPDKAREVLGADVKTTVADLGDKAALEKALRGVDSLFLTTAVNPNLAEQNSNAIDAAVQASVKYLVRLSAGRAVVGPDSIVPSGRTQHAVDEKLQGSKLGWVTLRPGLFMQNWLGQAATIKSDSKVVMPYAADFPIAWIDVRDTGAVAARILIDPKPHAGKTYEFTGKRTTNGEFAKVFSEVLGRPIAYVPVTVDQNEGAMKSRNMPDWLVAHLVAIAKVGNAGGFSNENTKVIEDLVKRPPLTTRQFVEAHKAAFA
jgi:NAD(P)H dehydrogenase (quinone)